MPGSAVIADTNFYRSTSDATVADLVALERLRGVRPIATFLVCSELLGHLTDTQAPEYRAYRASIRRLFQHCNRNDEIPPLSFIAHPHDILANSLFGVQLPGRHHLVDSFGGIIRRAALATPADVLPDVALGLLHIRRHRDEMEEQFVNSLEGIRQQFGLDPTLPSEFPPEQRMTPEAYLQAGLGRMGFLQALVMVVAKMCEISLTDAELDRHARRLFPEVAAAALIFEERLGKVLLDGAAPANQRNYVWDAYLTMTAATHLTQDGTAVALLTDDQAIHRAIAKAGGAVRVFTLESYREYLGSAGEP